MNFACYKMECMLRARWDVEILRLGYRACGSHLSSAINELMGSQRDVEARIRKLD